MMAGGQPGEEGVVCAGDWWDRDGLIFLNNSTLNSTSDTEPKPPEYQMNQ